MVTQVQDSPLLPQLLQEALVQSPDGIAIFDADDRVVFCNQPFAELFNHREESMPGKRFDELIRYVHETRRGLNIEAGSVDAWLAEAKDKRRQEPARTFQADTVDGRWFQLTEKLTADGYLLTFAREITPCKAAEARARELSDQLEQLAQTDELTGISNRRHFMHLASRELGRSIRHGHDACLLLLDIDQFKAVNDHFGHEAGDKVLSGIARRIKRELRQYDVFGRLGGEEFGILLPETALEDARRLAERLKELVEQLRFIETGTQCRVTVSVGVAHQSERNRFLEQIMHQADEALAKAKARGPNQVAASA